MYTCLNLLMIAITGAVRRDPGMVRSRLGAGQVSDGPKSQMGWVKKVEARAHSQPGKPGLEIKWKFEDFS